MNVYISLLRGVNVGGHNIVKMEALRALYASLGFEDARTYVQSGNVIFRAKSRDARTLAKRIEDAIEKAFGFRPSLIVRTSAEIERVIARNPFAARPGMEPAKLLVTFLAADPGSQAREALAKIKTDPEVLHLDGLELFAYYPNGIGQSKLSPAVIDRALKTPGTGRNWNTVHKLLEMAKALEAG